MQVTEKTQSLAEADIGERTSSAGRARGVRLRGGRRQRRRRLLPIAAILALAAAVVVIILRGVGDRGPGTGAVEDVVVGPEDVVVAKVERIAAGPQLAGTLVPERRATILSEVEGAVVEVRVRVGDRVASGAPLARLADAELEDAYRSSQAAVRSAETSVATAERDVERNENLAAAGAIPSRSAELARTELASAQAQLAQAEAQLSSARERWAATRIASPILGTVSERRVSVGDVVTPGASLFTIVDPSSMELEATIPAQSLDEVTVGAPVRFHVRGYPGRTFVGRLERVAPTADAATGQVTLFVSLPNPEGTLVAGLFGEGTVEAEARDALVVPASAIDESGGGHTVMRIRHGVTERVAVSTGMRDPATERVEIISGLEAGDTVLVGPARHIAPDTQVEVGTFGTVTDRERV